MQTIYADALKEGQMEVYRTRIMLVGHFAAGKTSVMRSLLNEDFIDKYVTTDGVETEETVDVFVVNVKKDKIYRWQRGTRSIMFL